MGYVTRSTKKGIKSRYAITRKGLFYVVRVKKVIFVVVGFYNINIFIIYFQKY